MANISEGWRFRGFEECSGGFYKAERGLKNFGRAREGTEKAPRGCEGTKKSEWDILGGAAREDSLGLCLMCFEVKDDYQKLSL